MKNDNTKKLEIENFFDEDSHDYLKFKYQVDKNSFISIRQRIVIECIDFFLKEKIQNSRILDAGCGPGLLINNLWNNEVLCYGLDLSKNMLMLAREANNNQAPNKPKFIRADIERIPFQNNSFDVLISLGVIEYLANDEKVISEFYRVLKPKGYFITAITNKYSYNLLFDNIIEYLKNREITYNILNRLKMRMNLGKIKTREFNIRKHSPFKFVKILEKNNFQLLHDKYFGLNLLPYPLNKFIDTSSDYINKISIRLSQSNFKYLCEGYLVLCQKR